MRYIKNALKFLTGILLIPLIASVSLSIYSQIKFLAKTSANSPFILGFLIYALAHLLFYNTKGENFVLRIWNRLYIIGHELMHAFTGMLSGGKVKGFSASSSRGSVAITKSNFFILLSPYFFPTYTILVALIYFLISLFKEGFYFNNTFVFLLGFSWGFHILLSLEYIKMGQQDLTEAGYIFSVVLVYLVNIVILAGILSLLFAKLSFKAFIFNSYNISKDMYLAVYRQLFL